MVMVMVGMVVIVVTHCIPELCWLLLSILCFRMVVLLVVVVVVLYRHKRSLPHTAILVSYACPRPYDAS